MQSNHNIEVADVFHEFGEEYIRKYNPSWEEQRVMRAIKICRTAELGGHIDVCSACGHEKNSYNSCRNRHCPKCQFRKKKKWLDDRLSESLPVSYFHIVFTIPSELNNMVLANKKLLYSILFKSSAETLSTLSDDAKYLDAKIGFISILHTWGQNLLEHPHIHCIVPAGGLRDTSTSLTLTKISTGSTSSSWVHSPKKFFLPVQVMKKVFKGKFLYYLNEAYKKKELKLTGKISYLKSYRNFQLFYHNLFKKEWNINIKPSFKNKESVFVYLAKYTHRIAISNGRLIKIKDGKVYFHWKDYRDNKKKIMALEGLEFIRRFLLHVLPNGFMKIRNYGLFCNRYKKKNIALCKKILGVKEKQISNTKQKSWKEELYRLTGFDVRRCSCCGKRTMQTIKILKPDYNGRSP